MIKPNIRQKIAIGIFIFLICFGCIGYLSLHNISLLGKELQYVEKSDDLNNIVLELRRVEKNYLLYGDKFLFSSGSMYLNDVETLLGSLLADFSSQSKLYAHALLNNIATYRSCLVKLEKLDENGSSLIRDAVVDKLRESGQLMVENAKEIVRSKRLTILSINEELRQNFYLSLIIVLSIVIILVFFVLYKIILPLQQVQEATKKISRGTFEPISIKNDHDEVQQVFGALNLMVEQLAKRRKQLMHAQKLSAIGTLASGIAHQLNNPLNNISTSSQILTENSELNDGLSVKMMQNITQETARARDIVRGLLEFSRNSELSLAPNSLKSIIADCIQLVSGQIHNHIMIKYDFEDDFILRADKQKLKEVFVNLFINAVQAIEPNDGQILIVAKSLGKKVEIKVTDTGAGIEAEKLERIFEPFYSTKEVGQGTGLGLYVVYGIIEQHGGSIKVKSSLGVGTEFIIVLPLAVGA